MLLRCKATTPTLPEARRLGHHYVAGSQEFAVVLGNEYLAYGLRVWGAGVWVDIQVEAGYLHTVPLALFDVLDSQVPALWTLRSEQDGDCALLPEKFHQMFFIDDLVEGKADAVLEFQRVKAVLEEVGRIPPRQT